jgi:hypothetical protein
VKNFLMASFLATSAFIPTAHADTHDTGHYGLWTTFAGTTVNGNQMCGAGVFGGGKTFLIKAWGGFIFIQLMRDGWDLVEDKAITFDFQVDQAPVYTLRGLSHQGPDNKFGILEFQFNLKTTDPTNLDHPDEPFVVTFFNLLENGNQITFTFPGSEAPWFGSLVGSHDAITAFTDCVAKLKSESTKGITQSKVTQPY